MLLFTKTCGKSVLQLPSYYLISPSLSLSLNLLLSHSHSVVVSLSVSDTYSVCHSLSLSLSLFLSFSLPLPLSLSHTHTHAHQVWLHIHARSLSRSPLNCFGLTPCLCCLWLIRVHSIILKYLSSNTFQVSMNDPVQRAPRCQSIFFHGELLRTGTDRCKRRRQSDIVSQTKI